MKKLLLWLAAVVVILVCVDLAFGYTARRYISTHPLRGDYRSTAHLMSDTLEDLIVLGSSVSLNSINTQAIADSLGITAYNGGSNGQTMPFYLTMMEIIADKPGLKTVILGMKEDNLCDSGLGVRYNFLVPYYHMGYTGIDRRLESKSAVDKMMLNSALYRYNTIWFRILLYNFIEPGLTSNCGFIAKDIPAYFPERATPDGGKPLTEQRIAEFEDFVQLCRDKDIRLIVCIPPRYEFPATPNLAEDYLRSRASEGNFELWFDSYDTPISADSTLFFDSTHLNYIGAKAYTDTIITRLRQS